MKTKTVSYNVYTVRELQEFHPEGFERAHQDYVNDGIDYDWYQFVYDDTKIIGGLLGMEIDKIYFSGFSSQGDGACFEGSYQYKKGCVKAIKEYAPQDMELHKIAEDLQAIQRKNFYRLWANVQHSGHYYHAYCTDIQVGSDNESMGGANDEAYDCIKELLRDFMNWIYSQLEKEYEYLTSEEQFIEMSDANDYEYAENGKLV
jgi:hypothetical protein